MARKSVVLGVLLAALASVTFPFVSAAAPTKLSPQAARNRLAAVHQAGLRLRQVRFPAGSHRVKAPPAAIGNLLSGPPYTFGGNRNVERHGFWIVPSLGPKALLRWVGHHRPPGSHSGDSSSGTGPSPISHEWEWPETGRVWGSDVTVSPVAYRGGSVVRLDSDAVWLLPRSRREHIPTTVRIVDLKIEPGQPEIIEEGVPSSPPLPTRHLRISNPTEVQRLVRIVNRQRLVQLSGPHSCPPEAVPVAAPGEPLPPPPSLVRLFFRLGRHQPAIASVTQREKPGICNEMGIEVRGVPMPELEGGYKVLAALLPQRSRAR
jgi:hypothetical protein